MIDRGVYFGEVGRDIYFEEVDRGEYFGELNTGLKSKICRLKSKKIVTQSTISRLSWQYCSAWPHILDFAAGVSECPYCH